MGLLPDSSNNDPIYSFFPLVESTTKNPNIYIYILVCSIDLTQIHVAPPMIIPTQKIWIL